MDVVHGLEAFPRQQVPVVLALGTFDGVHRGHQTLLLDAVRLAGERGGRVTAEQIVETLLIGRPVAVGEAVIKRCAAELGLLDGSGRLTAAGREQYDQAKSFGEQADEAIGQRNYVFAETLADKAAKLATELLGR